MPRGLGDPFRNFFIGGRVHSADMSDDRFVTIHSGDTELPTQGAVFQANISYQFKVHLKGAAPSGNIAMSFRSESGLVPADFHFNAPLGALVLDSTVLGLRSRFGAKGKFSLIFSSPHYTTPITISNIELI